MLNEKEKNTADTTDNKINDKNKKKNKIKSLGDKETVVLGSEKLRNRERKIRVVKLGLLIITLFLIIIYFLLRLFYEGGAFTVALDDNLDRKAGIIMYERIEEKDSRKILKVDELQFIDNISINWIPSDVNNQGEGSHNGQNYIAYTFYIENKGIDTINYWYNILVDDVVKDVDKAIRIMLYRNDERIVYAKPSSSGAPEPGTEAFLSDTQIALKQRTDFKPGDIDKYTIVIFLEGDDPDCVDALIGGMMKIHMDITEEHMQQDDNQEQQNTQPQGE